MPLNPDYTHITLSGNIEDRARELKKYIGKTIICNLEYETKSLWSEGELYRTEKYEEFRIRKGNGLAKRLELNKLKEIIVKINPTDI